MQLLPEYFPGAGVDPSRDIGTAGTYLASLSKRFGGDWQLALAAYDWGPGSVRRWQSEKGVFSTMPEETQAYVRDIVTDVPVGGVLCRTLSPLSPPVTGSPTSPSSGAPSSETAVAQIIVAVCGHYLKAPSTPSPPGPSRSLCLFTATYFIPDNTNRSP